MSLNCLHNRDEIETLLKGDPYLHLYSMGDLDEFFWHHTVWYTLDGQEERCGQGDSRPVALLYFGYMPPTLLALHQDATPMRELLKALLPLLPQRFQAHLSPGVESVFAQSGTMKLTFHGEHFKMGLTNPAKLMDQDTAGTVPLGVTDREEVLRFYSECYPENWFDPRMLETGQYFGIRHERTGALASVAGIHVYSPRYGVAALGNIATAPGERSRGLARRVTARLCRSLLEPPPRESPFGPITRIGLNVKADNAPAIAAYRKLGFEILHTYNEYVVSSATDHPS